MTVQLQADAEALLVRFLRTQPEIVAIAGTRAATQIPSPPVFPLVRVVRIGGSPVRSLPLHLDRPTLQVEAYGPSPAVSGASSTARRLADTCRAVIAERIVGPHLLVDGPAWVTSVSFGALLYVPDPDIATPTAHPRYLFDVTLHTHT